MANPNLVKGVVLNPHGRPKGTKNKFSKTAKEVIQTVANKLGERRGFEDATGALLDWVERDPRHEVIFWKDIWPKLIVVTKVDTFDVADEVPWDFKIMDPESNGAARSTRAVQNRTVLAARAAEVADSDRSAAHIRLSSGHEGSVAPPRWPAGPGRLHAWYVLGFHHFGRLAGRRRSIRINIWSSSASITGSITWVRIRRAASSATRS